MGKRRGATENPYSVSPGVAMVRKWIDTLREKTGRSLEEWTKFGRAKGPKDEDALRAWLKDEHGMGTNSAWFLAERILDKPGAADEDTPEQYLKTAVAYVEAQYSGKKAAMRPVYERLLEIGLATGKDAKACPCKTMVPLYREHVFANITPAANTRVDLGLALAKVPESKIPKRLIDTGGKAKKDRITHRIPIASVDEIDAVVRAWVRTAYELDESEPRAAGRKRGSERAPGC